MAAVEAIDLCKSFGDIPALRNVSFTIPQGSLCGLIGADGAGKTTLLRILVTLISADKGKATVLGNDVATGLGAIRNSVGYMPQRFSLYQDLSVRENLRFFADIFGVGAADRRVRMDRLLRFSKLAPFLNRRAAHLSGGMKQKLALSCALIHTPSLLILDEPTTGVDPVSRKEFQDILFELKKDGITILFSTPYMDEAMACDSLLLLHKGAIVRQGTPEDLLASYPYILYRVTGRSGSITVPQDAVLPDGVALMYPEAGALHVAVRDELAQPNSLLSQLRQYVPAADAIERTAPTIEDLFFFLLTEKK